MYDVIIIGSGIVGLVNALLLAQKTALRIAVLDAKTPEATWSSSTYDARVYALTPSSQRTLNELGVWETVTAKRASAFTKMYVWDPEGGGELQFDHRQLNVPALGYIVEENLLRETLLEKLKSYSQLKLFGSIKITDIQEHQDHLSLYLVGPFLLEAEALEGGVINTRLLIGADGAQSFVREKANLPLKIHNYNHASLIAQVETELPHQATARQCFLSGSSHPSGPLAFLPLAGPHQCSIVWSTLPENADTLLQMEESAFQKALGEAFEHRLGQITSVSKRAVFPLYERHAETYVKERIALIGDAAHTLHPLAGQGMNLGIADASALAQVVTEAVNKKREFYSRATLRRYERARKGNNLMMLSAVKFFKAIFTSEAKTTQVLRSQGLNLSNRIGLLKTFFARYAMG